MNEDTVMTGLIPDEPVNIDEITTTVASTTIEKSTKEITTNAKNLIEVNGIDKDNYFAPDVREQIKKAISARQYKPPHNRAERRALMKKMSKQKYNEFMAVSETAAKLDYVDLIQKFRELNERKMNEKEIENNEDIEENN